MQKKSQADERPADTAHRDIGAIVFLIAHATGEFEVSSVDRKVTASGSTLNQAWWRFYKKAERVMKKQGTLERAHPTVEPPDIHNDSEEATISEDAMRAADDGFVDA